MTRFVLHRIVVAGLVVMDTVSLVAVGYGLFAVDCSNQHSFQHHLNYYPLRPYLDLNPCDSIQMVYHVLLKSYLEGFLVSLIFFLVWCLSFSRAFFNNFFFV